MDRCAEKLDGSATNRQIDNSIQDQVSKIGGQNRQVQLKEHYMGI
jgi:hypothetical protein